MTVTINERMIILYYREIKFLSAIQHNYVTPHWRHPLNIFIDKDPETPFQTISDEVFNPSSLKPIAVKEALMGCGTEQHLHQTARVLRAKILKIGPVINLYKRMQPVTISDRLPA